MKTESCIVKDTFTRVDRSFSSRRTRRGVRGRRQNHEDGDSQKWVLHLIDAVLDDNYIATSSTENAAAKRTRHF